VAPFLGFAGALAAMIFAGTQRLLTFLSTALACAGAVLTAGFSLFPFLMPSSLHPAVSLTVWDASSSATTLGVMALVTAVFLPLVLLYTAWVYRVLRGPVTQDAISRDPHSFY
jgi:cytochrome d ubiquinol oxidase subunit II